jgi:hypothetical protein
VERKKEDGNGKQKNTEISENDVKNGDGSVVELQFRFKDLSSDNGNHDIRSNDVSNLND